MPFELDRNQIPRAAGEGWSLAFDTPAKGCFTLNAGEDLVLRSGCISFDDLSEEAALPERRRVHLSEDGEESSLDASCTIPFGAEPSIVRKAVLMKNRLALRTDLIMRNSMPMRSIDAGNLTVSGKLKRVGILLHGKNAALPEIQWSGFTPEFKYRFEKEMPLAVLVESVSGTVLELSTGEDLWRWANAASLEGKNSFTLAAEKGALVFKRTLYSWIQKTDQEPPSGRNWRICSSFAWSPSGIREKKGRLKKAAFSFDLSSYEWPESALAAGSDGKPVPGLPCFASETTVNILKKWLRSCFASLKEGDIVRFTHGELACCFNASHQDRPKKRELLHWDTDALTEFRRWAERQVSSYGASVEFIPEKGGTLASLPSGHPE